jgi:pilus assembly protein CpaB
MRTAIIGLLALVCGVSAMFVANSLVNNRTPEAPKVETTSVVVANFDVPRGETLRDEHLKIREFPKEFAPSGALTSIADAVGRVTASQMIKDEPVLESKLAPKGAGRGVAALIPKGMRAFTILTPNLASNVAGFILPGNKVDVLLTVGSIGSDDQTGGGSTVTLLQNVEIWAVGQRVEAPTESRVDVREQQSVTLLVTPQQATELDLGQNKGTLHLSLRNPEDAELTLTKPSTLVDLHLFEPKPRANEKLANDKEPVEPPVRVEPEPPSVQVRTLRGTQEGSVLIAPQSLPPGKH